MSPSESDDDTKKTGQQPEPLCLFYFAHPAPDAFADDQPDEGRIRELGSGRTYLPPPEKEEDKLASIKKRLLGLTPRGALPADRRSKRKSPQSTRKAKLVEQTPSTDSGEHERGGTWKQKEGREWKRKPEGGGRRKEEEWPKRRGMGGRFNRKRGKKTQEPVRHLKSLLLTSVKDEVLQRGQLPSLVEVLKTLEDAWPPHSSFCQDRNEEETSTTFSQFARPAERKEKTPKMLQFAQPLMNRRFSVPEEVMRKYSVTKERTSEESEENHTMPEITTPSSKECEKVEDKKKQKVAKEPPEIKIERPRNSRERNKEILRSHVFSKKIDDEEMKITYHVSTSTKGSKVHLRSVPQYEFREVDGEKSFVVLSDTASPKSSSTEPVLQTARHGHAEFDDEDDVLNIIQESSGTDSEEEEELAQLPKRETRTMWRAPLRRGSVFEQPEAEPEPKRVTQNEYYNQGKGIIRLKAMEKGSQTADCTCKTEKPESSTTASAKEESDASGTSESISSPTPCRREEDFDNLSSESEDIRCTCAELTSSKDTSSDRFHSGKSTLSQTVSEKSTSTQDSTVSINSVSTRGSTISCNSNSNSTSPEIDPKTSAKETTTSPDHTPRTPRSRSRSFGPSRRPGDKGQGPCDQSRRSEGKGQGPHDRGRPQDGHQTTCPKYGNGGSVQDTVEEKQGRTYGHGQSASYGLAGKQSSGYDHGGEQSSGYGLAGKQSSGYDHGGGQSSSYGYCNGEGSGYDHEYQHPKHDGEKSARDEPGSSRSRHSQFAEDLYNIPNRNPDEPSPRPPHSCTDNINCSTPITDNYQLPKMNVSDDESSSESTEETTKSVREAKPKSKLETEVAPSQQSDLQEAALTVHETSKQKDIKDTFKKTNAVKEVLTLENVDKEIAEVLLATQLIESQSGENGQEVSENFSEVQKTQTTDQYKWAKLTEEEIYMMQQQRHRKFIENQRRFSIPIAQTPDTGTLAACVPSAYKDEEENSEFIVPRYSALPRSLSMIVNTSSAETSVHNSDSDNQSLADSLEEHPTTHMHRLYFDTKQESKPVRGDVTNVEEKERKTRQEQREQRGRAFFVSITEQGAEAAVLTDITKIPEPPDKIKNQIFERHFNLCKKNEKLLSNAEVQTESKAKMKSDRRKVKKFEKNQEETFGKEERQIVQKSIRQKSSEELKVEMKETAISRTISNELVQDKLEKKLKSKVELERTTSITQIASEEKDMEIFRKLNSQIIDVAKIDRVLEEDNKNQKTKKEKEPKPEIRAKVETQEIPQLTKRKSRETKSKFYSKIPVPITDMGRSTSSSPEGDREPRKYPGRHPKRITRKPQTKLKSRNEAAPRSQVNEAKVEHKQTVSKSSAVDKRKTEIKEKETIPTKHSGRSTAALTSTSSERATGSRKQEAANNKIDLTPIPETRETHIITLNTLSTAPSHKPQAVIHPSQPPVMDHAELSQRRLSLASSLENTATILKLQQVQLPQLPQRQKRSPNMRFQQRFEVIPEERSSSLTSSAEERWSTEKPRRASLPVKLTEIRSDAFPAAGVELTSGTGINDGQFRRYSLGSINNVIIAKLMGRPLQAIPCIQRGPNNENQQIIVLSPKDGMESTSSKGRDALLAMNREDFNRLSQGWMNFYLLKPDSEGENSHQDDQEPDSRDGKKDKQYTISNFNDSSNKGCKDRRHNKSEKTYMIEDVNPENKNEDYPSGRNTSERKEKEYRDDKRSKGEKKASVHSKRKSDKKTPTSKEREKQDDVVENEGRSKGADEGDSKTIVCRIPSMERDPSSTTATSSGGGTEEEKATKCLPGSGNCNTPRDDTTIETKPQEREENEKNHTTMFMSNKAEFFEDVKTSELVLIEKSDSQELMCLNGKDDIDEPSSRETAKINNETLANEHLGKENSLPSEGNHQPVATATEKPVDKTKNASKDKKVGKTKVQKEPRILIESKNLDDNIRFHCSNTILQTTKPIFISPRSSSAKSKRQSSLPELKVQLPKNNLVHKTRSSVEILPRVTNPLKPSDQEDSDSTVYLQPPSPRVPPLPLEGSEDFLSDGTLSSSSDSDMETKATPVLPTRYLPLRRRGVSNRARLKRESHSFESPRVAKPGGSGWSVTVAGTVRLSSAAPDVEMRLSFPVSTRPPVASQSDSGFAEDANSSQNLEQGRLRRQPGLLPPANVKQKWTVTVKNPTQGQDGSRQKSQKKNDYNLLPELGQTRNTKKGLKVQTTRTDVQMYAMERKLSQIWPRVQEMIQSELAVFTSGAIEEPSDLGEVNLSVQGSAVPFERKPRVPTMSERDVTRQNTSRSSTKT